MGQRLGRIRTGGPGLGPQRGLQALADRARAPAGAALRAGGGAGDSIAIAIAIAIAIIGLLR